MRRVAEAMDPPVIVAPGSTLQEASAQMLDAHAHAAVIVDGGRVCGLATAERIAAALSEGYDAAETAIGIIAEPDPPTAHPDEPLLEAHARMRSEGHRRVAVVGRDHEPLGVLEDSEAATASG